MNNNVCLQKPFKEPGTFYFYLFIFGKSLVITKSVNRFTATVTHTHICFCEKWGHTIGVMVFILYKLYVQYKHNPAAISPYSSRPVAH